MAQNTGVFVWKTGLKGKLASPKMVNYVCQCICMVCLEYDGLFRKFRCTCFGFTLFLKCADIKHQQFFQLGVF